MLAEDLERDPVRYQGNWIPHKLRAATADGVFFVGDSAGHCLPLTAEGIRTAFYFGIACGRELRAVVDGKQSIASALARYGDFSEAHRWKFEAMLAAQRLVPRVPPRLLHRSIRAMQGKRFLDWSFGHYLEIAPPSSPSTAYPILPRPASPLPPEAGHPASPTTLRCCSVPELRGASERVYEVVAQRRLQWDNLVWQVPVVGLTAQAFLFTIALSTGNSQFARATAAFLALVAALLSMQLMARQRQSELTDAHWLNAYERGQLRAPRSWAALADGPRRDKCCRALLEGRSFQGVDGRLLALRDRGTCDSRGDVPGAERPLGGAASGCGSPARCCSRRGPARTRRSSRVVLGRSPGPAVVAVAGLEGGLVEVVDGPRSRPPGRPCGGSPSRWSPPAPRTSPLSVERDPLGRVGLRAGCERAGRSSRRSASRPARRPLESRGDRSHLSASPRSAPPRCCCRPGRAGSRRSIRRSRPGSGRARRRFRSRRPRRRARTRRRPPWSSPRSRRAVPAYTGFHAGRREREVVPLRTARWRPIDPDRSEHRVVEALRRRQVGDADRHMIEQREELS